MQIEFTNTSSNSTDLGWVVFANRKLPNRALTECDTFTKELYSHHMLPKGQAIFRLTNDNSKTCPIVLIDRDKNKLHFLRDYDVEPSAWDRGHKVEKLMINDADDFITQFDSVENILLRD